MHGSNWNPTPRPVQKESAKATFIAFSDSLAGTTRLPFLLFALAVFWN